jgi:hypothetical protein
VFIVTRLVVAGLSQWNSSFEAGIQFITIATNASYSIITRMYVLKDYKGTSMEYLWNINGTSMEHRNTPGALAAPARGSRGAILIQFIRCLKPV